MFSRSPLAPVALLALAVCAITVPESAHGLLLLTPALAVVLPLLFSFYPGESSVARLACWFSRLSLPRTSGTAFTAVAPGSSFPAATGFSGANGSRGPPFLCSN